jgi:quinol monooxygenase YgiN
LRWPGQPGWPGWPPASTNLAAMIVLSRFRVDAAAEVTFREQADAAIAVLRRRDGLLSLDFGRNLDDPELWTITTRWVDVGSYRRALSGIESKSVVVPLLSLAVDEPSAYEDPELVGENWARGAVRPG